MTSFKRARLEIWCEDREHETFARELLLSLGAERRDLRFNIAPRGKGAASDWVTKQYGNTVTKRVRAVKNAQPRLGFLVIVDGDAEGFEVRKQRLESEGDRSANARVAFWIPCWSIETWVLWLCGEAVTEDKPLKTACDFRNQVAAAIAAWTSPRDGERQSVPALSAARKELERVATG